MDSAKANDSNHSDNTSNTVDQTEKGAHRQSMHSDYAENECY